MGELKLFTIDLVDNPSGVYFPGDVVKGNVFLELEGEGKKARGVHVEIQGKSHVEFTKRKTGAKSIYYSDDETYFKERTYFIGDGSTEMQIAAGVYEHSFQFQIPQNIPSSFIGECGKVAYSVTGVIDEPWKFDNESVAFFTVICNYDLNLPGIEQEKKKLVETPQSMSDHKNLCCFCCKSGPLSASVQILERGCYVPGETIRVQAMADNKTNRLMEGVLVSLTQTVTYKADGLFGVEKKECKNSIVGHEMGTVEPGDSESWPEIALKIPALPPSDLEHCNKIDIKYSVMLTVNPEGCHLALAVSAPVVIGTIPPQSMFSAISNLKEETEGVDAMKAFMKKTPPPSSEDAYAMKEMQSTGTDIPPQSSEAAVPPPPSNLYPDLPLPTYEQATTWGKRMDYEQITLGPSITGNWDFQPIYPYYGNCGNVKS